MLNCMATCRSTGQKAGAVTKMDTCNMASNISEVLKFAATPAIEAMKQAMPDYRNIGTAALETMKVGDRPMQEQFCMRTG